MKMKQPMIQSKYISYCADFTSFFIFGNTAIFRKCKKIVRYVLFMTNEQVKNQIFLVLTKFLQLKNVSVGVSCS